jgi:methylmalonyl-CoA mutase
MKVLYSGFDLCAANNSVSMTINGPAPTILAMFMNTAIDQRVERHLRAAGRWQQAQDALRTAGVAQPAYRGELPAGRGGQRQSGLNLTACRRGGKEMAASTAMDPHPVC